MINLLKFKRFLLVLSALTSALVFADDPNSVLLFPHANSRETYFSVHHIKAAQEVSKGRGIKVGILDHSFGLALHPDLYQGGQNFVENGDEFLLKKEWHGYWMARVLREIAPEAEIYALNTHVFKDKVETARSMVVAIDWAIKEKLDILTYSGASFEGESRTELYKAMDRAHEAGIATVFIHCGQPGNIFPTGLWGGVEDGREPDVNVLQYDYSVVFIKEYQKAFAGEKSWYRPFLSISSTAPVVAGTIALMKSHNPTLSPDQCRHILRDSSYPKVFEGKKAPRTLDAFEALKQSKPEK